MTSNAERLIEEAKDRRLQHAVAAWEEIAPMLRTAYLKAVRKHGPMASAHEGYAVLLEEVDELWTEIKRQNVYPGQTEKEALDVGAMAVRFLADVIPGLRVKASGTPYAD